MVAPTFSKKERIVSKKLMETLFEKGDSQAVTSLSKQYICPSIGHKVVPQSRCSSVFLKNDSNMPLTGIG